MVQKNGFGMNLWIRNGLAWVGFALAGCGVGRAAQPAHCQQVELKGEVQAGSKWRAEIGQGWFFGLLPVASGTQGFTGWDMVVDNEPGAGFPDALLLATPPYGSLNEHEIATTFGLRAQDAAGWSPRSFHFLTDATALAESRRLFPLLSHGHGMGESPTVSKAEGLAIQRQLALNQKASRGELHIDEARIAPGTADAAGFAENWAWRFQQLPHLMENPASDKATPSGELHWIRFTVRLWLPSGWRLPAGLKAKDGPCGV